MITIEVTREDIDQGVRTNCKKCPVALAISRAIGYDDVEVSTGSFYANFGGNWGLARIMQPLPKFVIALIRWFDTGHKIAPFSFAINDVEVKR